MLTEHRSTTTEAVGKWEPGNGASYLLHVVVVDPSLAPLLHCTPGALRITLANNPNMPSVYMQGTAPLHPSYVATKMGIGYPDAVAVLAGIQLLVTSLKVG